MWIQMNNGKLGEDKTSIKNRVNQKYGKKCKEYGKIEVKQEFEQYLMTMKQEQK